MDPKKTVGASKFLSLILRHQPETIGLTLDAEGWADVEELLDKATAAGTSLNRRTLEDVLALPGKQRFELSPDGTRLRAMQGHSAAGVAIAYPPVTPPEILYHGTATRFLAAIREQGVLPGSRHLVHLSLDRETAAAVGQRHGTAAVVAIDAGTMHRQGYEFYCAANGVWLTQKVPTEFIRFPQTHA